SGKGREQDEICGVIQGCASGKGFKRYWQAQTMPDTRKPARRDAGRFPLEVCSRWGRKLIPRCPGDKQLIVKIAVWLLCECGNQFPDITANSATLFDGWSVIDGDGRWHD